MTTVTANHQQRLHLATISSTTRTIYSGEYNLEILVNVTAQFSNKLLIKERLNIKVEKPGWEHTSVQSR